MFEVKYESDTCNQHPLKTLQLHELCDSVTEPSLSISVRFIISFLRELCQFAFSYYNQEAYATCVCNITCAACAHTQKIGRSWLLFLHGPNIIITWVMQFIIFKRVVCIIITNKHHNRHVCNSNEGTKVSFMLKEIIYGKSPIFSPVINTFFGRNIDYSTRIVTSVAVRNSCSFSKLFLNCS